MAGITYRRKSAPVEEPAHGKPREAPTAAEAEFGELLEDLLPLALDFCFWTDEYGVPWMVASLDFSEGPFPDPLGPNADGMSYRWVKALRLDFDSAGIRGGWSTGQMDWDADLRAEVANVDTSPPQGINLTADDSTPAELARAAASWFERHWADWVHLSKTPADLTVAPEA
jgi:hypothetical protein